MVLACACAYLHSALDKLLLPVRLSHAHAKHNDGVDWSSSVYQVAALLQLSPSADWATKEEHQEKAQQSAAEMIESQSAPYAFMLDLSILRSHCLAAGLSRYKLPLLAFGSHDALPTNSAGKHIKPAVKALLLQHMSHKGDVLSKL